MWYLGPMKLDESAPDDLAVGVRALEDKLLQAYLARVNDRNPRARKKAVRGLASLGAAAAQAVPVLLSLSDEDQDAAVRAAARWALGKIQS